MQQPQSAEPSCEQQERQSDENGSRSCIGGHENHTELCDCMLDIAVALFGVNGKELRAPGRSTSDVSRVRQITMYVSHVILGLSMSDIGDGFGRDRTTVLYACHVIEDLRDDREFDAMVSLFEQIAAAALKARDGQGR